MIHLLWPSLFFLEKCQSSYIVSFVAFISANLICFLIWEYVGVCIWICKYFRCYGKCVEEGTVELHDIVEVWYMCAWCHASFPSTVKPALNGHPGRRAISHMHVEGGTETYPRNRYMWTPLAIFFSMSQYAYVNNHRRHHHPHDIIQLVTLYDSPHVPHVS